MEENNKEQDRKKRKGDRPNYQVWVIITLLTVIFGIIWFGRSGSTKEINKKDFEEIYLRHDVEKIVVVGDRTVEVYMKKGFQKNSFYQENKNLRLEQSPFTSERGPHYHFNIGQSDKFEEWLDKVNKEKRVPAANQLPVEIETNRDNSYQIINIGFIILLFVGFWYLMRRMTNAGPGGQIFNIGKSKAALFDAENKVKITFADVAGLEEGKEEVREIVDFLKNPTKFTKLGGKIPKGALLVGPPGTGKTLLAKAVAGEANVPFFSLSGSDFVEMFVGVGAARVRDLFKQAKEKAPCIIFIDEVDAIGRMRGKGSLPGANDERENTLNSLLVEMDGFATDSGVIILAATNRPDILDSALLRPGRFDRMISVDKPDIIGREQIFKVHLKPLKLSGDVDPKKLAAQTPGFAGAEIANVCNEAALIAARKNKEAIDMSDFQDAVDRVIGGLEKKNKIISPEEKKIVAYHEAGHAVTGWFLEHADPLVKVSIVPRGVAALGYAQYLPKEQFLYTQEQLMDEMCMTLGGRAAEEIVFGKVSTGALSDLERITKLAYSIVTVYGMNDKIGNVSFYDSKQSEYSFTKPYSEETSKTIDDEVRKLITGCYERSKQLLSDKRKELEFVAQELLRREIIFQSDLEILIGKRPFDKQTTYQAFMDKQPEPSTNGQEEKKDEKKDESKEEEKAKSGINFDKEDNT